MDSIQVGDRVIHNGIEKEVTREMGDILLLREQNGAESTAIPSEVSRVPRSGEGVENQQTSEETPQPEIDISRADLRRDIEGLDQNSPVSTVMRIMNRVDSRMVINTTVDWEPFKRDIIRRALELNRIDPKVCEHCGQTIPE